MPAFLVLIDRAERLRNTDRMGKSDPYVSIRTSARERYGYHETLTTKVIDNNLSPVWNECFLIDTRTFGHTVTLDVMDSDAGMIVNGTDDHLGFTSFSFNRPESFAGRDLQSATDWCARARARESRVAPRRPRHRARRRASRAGLKSASPCATWKTLIQGSSSAISMSRCGRTARRR